MKHRVGVVAWLGVVSVALSGCPDMQRVSITAPFEEQVVVTAAVPISVDLDASVNGATFAAELNGVDVNGAFTVTATDATATLTVGAGPAVRTGRNRLVVSAQAGAATERDVAEFSVALGNAVAQQVGAGQEALLIEGPNARGRVGDYVLYNDVIQVVIDDVSPLDAGDTVRAAYGVHVFGGNIIDADLMREPGDPERDNFEAWIPTINVENTANYRTITVVNDGSNGAPAVIRAEGPDDLIDTQNLSSLVVFLGGGLFGLPAANDDTDLPVDVVTEYSLAPGDNFVTVTTTVHNQTATALQVPIGDMVNCAGDREEFQPGLGYAGASGSGTQLRLSSDYVAYVPRGPDMEGVSYGYVPELQGVNNAVTQSGQHIILLGDSVLDLLTGGTPSFTIPGNGSNSYVRRFVVGNGDMTAVAAVRDRELGVAHGTLEGFVTSGGRPIENARVSVRTPFGDLFQDFDVIAAFETDADGHYIGTVPAGTYRIVVHAEGYPPAGGRDVQITAGATSFEQFQIAETGALAVTVVDEGGAPISAKVSVVGLDPSPLPTVGLDLLGAVQSTGGVVRTLSDALPRGVSAVRFAGPTGAVDAFPIEPGTYKVVMSHGPEYDVHSEEVTVAAGATETVNAVVRKVLDTAGFVSADFHQHATDSFDAPATDTSRVLANLAEGVDFFVSTDHDFTSDLSPQIAALGAAGLVGYDLGIEVTPSDYGHINPWPIARDPSSRNFGAIDWGKGAPPGEDFPSFGNYSLSPGELYAALRLADPDPGTEVIQMNHVNSVLQGTLDGLQIDTGVVPPQSGVDPLDFRLDPSIPNLFDPSFDAMELWIGSGNDDIELLVEQNLGDWMNLLNQGLVKTAACNSDSHVRAMVQVGQPRTFVASSTDDPASVDSDELAENVQDGRATCSNGPFVTASIEAASTGETASLAHGQPRLASTTDGAATLTLDIQAAPWVAFDTVDVYVNTVPVGVDADGDPATPPEYGVTPQMTLVAGVDFAIANVAVNGSSRQEATVTVPLAGLARDAWVVAVVRGTEGVSAPMFPVVPNDVDGTQTLADLFVNDPAEPGVRALAFTNPLLVDADNNDVFDPPL